MASDELVVESSDSKAKPEDYVIIGKYRLVAPYHFDFVCSVRQRWFGQTIIDLFSREFPARDRTYYKQALADGRLRVEGQTVGEDTPLKDGMRMRHFIHRHEPPVPAGPIKVVGETPDIVAVCKPHGMPVHVAGQYRKNTVAGILAAERPDLGELLPVHRLDKPVSGLLLFARHTSSADALRQKIEGRTVEKVYVARVLGTFPASEAPIVVDVPLAWDPSTNHATAVPEAAVPAAVPAFAPGAGQGAVEAPVQASDPAAAQQQLQHQEGGQGLQNGGGAAPAAQAEQQQRQQYSRRERRAAKRIKQAAAAATAAAAKAAAEAGGEQGSDSKRGAKPSVTEFRLLWVAQDGKTSLVECRPRTGRTHQIRVHLQYLGHPIANDAQYGGTYGGPLPSRLMAQELGVAWDRLRCAAPAAADGGAAEKEGQQQQQQQEHLHNARRQQDQQQLQNEGDAATSAAFAGSSAEGCAGMAKRARTDAATSTACGDNHPAQPPQQQQEEEGALTEGAAASSADQAAAGGAAAGAGAAAGQDVYAENQAFRSSPEFQASACLHDPLCIHCPYYAPRDYPLDLRPLWLHARTYSCEDGEWSFSADLPGWAHRDYVLQ